jgi:hypothetical protein
MCAQVHSRLLRAKSHVIQPAQERVKYSALGAASVRALDACAQPRCRLAIGTGRYRFGVHDGALTFLIKKFHDDRGDCFRAGH